MDPQAVRATVVIVLLAVGSAGGAWLYNAMVGPPLPAQFQGDADDVLTLVEFQPRTMEIATETIRFTGSGTVEFAPLVMARGNVTSVSVSLNAAMQGPTAQDTFSVLVTAPDAQSHDGEAQRSATPSGYEISVPVIDSWARDDLPESTHYATDDEAEALRWAAENHTRSRSTGDWLAEVSLSPPLTPLRDGNVSLLFRFTYYEALAFAPLADDERDVGGRPVPGFSAASATRHAL